MMDFGDVILRTLFPSFMSIQACTQYYSCTALRYDSVNRPAGFLY